MYLTRALADLFQTGDTSGASAAYVLHRPGVDLKGTIQQARAPRASWSQEGNKQLPEYGLPQADLSALLIPLPDISLLKENDR